MTKTETAITLGKFLRPISEHIISTIPNPKIIWFTARFGINTNTVTKVPKILPIVAIE